MTLEDRGFLDLGEMRLEYRFDGPRPHAAPTIVLLHEGLGSMDVWGSFAQDLAAATGAGIFSYSRAGYGRSSPSTLPRPVTFMHDEARRVLPRVLDAIGFRRGLLLGHSDGASIAAIYAGSIQDHRVRGLVLVAPHFVTEDMGLAEIARAKAAFEQGSLRTKLARIHADADNAFHNWCDPWLHPEFRKLDLTEELAHIRVPILIVQGEYDQFGTVRQIEVAQHECYCPVEVVLLPRTRHAPHRERPERTLRAVADFCNRLLRDHREGIVFEEPARSVVS
ncbi:MAG TPA: alpha/beta hydrolase [Xanthobacteraceae bacterium]|jgi:pimeloyl-ACP methyl ester carboxylesterase